MRGSTVRPRDGGVVGDGRPGLEPEHEEEILVHQSNTPFLSRRLSNKLAWVQVWTVVCVFVVAVLVAVAVVRGGGEDKHDDDEDDDDGDFPKNVIFLIGDGFGLAQMTLARAYMRQLTGDHSFTLAQDAYLVGASRTESFDSFVTDSAAGATAFTCGAKTFNGNVSVGIDGRACPTLFEAAARANFLTGTVSTSRVTHATPGAFAAHAIHRDNENHIAQQQIEVFDTVATRPMQVLFGGGLQHFLPATDPDSCRQDALNLTASAQARGFSLAFTAAEMEALSSLPALGLFARGHMDYEIDRAGTTQPALVQMTHKALQLLERGVAEKGAKGFALMVEGSRIDMAAHMHDSATVAREVLAFEEAFEAAIDFAKSRGDTLVVATADHETGGLGLGYQWGEEYPQYQYSLEPLFHISNSTEVLANAIARDAQGNRALLRDTMLWGWNGLNATDDELDAVEAVAGEHPDPNGIWPSKLEKLLTEMVDRRCGIGYTTHGHTGTDVGVYAFGPGSASFRGHHENNNIGAMLAAALRVQVASLRPQVVGLAVRNDDNGTECRHAKGTAAPWATAHHHRYHD